MLSPSAQQASAKPRETKRDPLSINASLLHGHTTCAVVRQGGSICSASGGGASISRQRMITTCRSTRDTETGDRPVC